eukprot:6828643-Pyramimonas_sp.AAC.1
MEQWKSLKHIRLQILSFLRVPGYDGVTQMGSARASMTRMRTLWIGGMEGGREFNDGSFVSAILHRFTHRPQAYKDDSE